MIYIYTIAICIAISIPWIWLWHRDRSQWLRTRISHPGLWECAFTAEEWPMADDALFWICDAFLLPAKLRHSLRPSDVILRIYRRYYPRHRMRDCMEYEELASYLEDAGHDPTILDRSDLTVRDLVELHAGRPRNNKEDTEQVGGCDGEKPTS